MMTPACSSLPVASRALQPLAAQVRGWAGLLLGLCAFACAVAFGLGCGSPQTPAATFERELNAFHAHMRWGRFNEAATYFEVADREGFSGEFAERGDDYEVTEYEIQSVEWDDRTHATVIVWVQSMTLPSTRVDEITYEEKWGYNDELRKWEITERREID